MIKGNGDTLIGGAFVALGLGVLVISLWIGKEQWGGESARLFPQIIAVVILLLGAQLLRQSMAETSKATNFNAATIGVLKLFALGIIYAFLIAKTGYLFSTALIAPLVFFVFGMRSLLGLALAAVLCPITFHILFFVVLGLFPPLGEWFDLTDLWVRY